MSFHPHALLELQGRLVGLSGTPEVFACGIRVVNGNTFGALPTDEIEGFLDALVAGDHGIVQTIPAWWQDSLSGIASIAKLDVVKLNNIGPDGKYSEAGITHLRDIGGASGGAAATAPSYCTLVYTWETGRTRGRAHRGRIYPPNFTYTFTGAEVAGGSTTAANLAAVKLIRLIRDAHNDDAGSDALHPIVASALDASWFEITGTTVDSVYDVQRRRKNQIQGTRSAVNSV